MRCCGKCKKQLTTIESIISENETEKIVHVIERCEDCKIIYGDFNKKVIKPKKRKKDSVLSIIACVFASVIAIPAFLIGIPHILAFPMFFVALILALIDIGINNKEKNHAGSILALVFSILYFIMLMVSCGV